MKKILTLTAISALFTLSSCTEDYEDVFETYEDIVKVEVTNTPGSENYHEILNIQIVAGNVEDTNINGVTWKEIIPLYTTYKRFMVEQSVPNKITYETSKPVSSITYQATILPMKDATSNEMTTTIRFSVKGKVKKTETFTVKGNETKTVDYTLDVK